MCIWRASTVDLVWLQKCLYSVVATGLCKEEGLAQVRARSGGSARGRKGDLWPRWLHVCHHHVRAWASLNFK